MTRCTDMGVTVSPDVGIYFLRYLKSMTMERPDIVSQDSEGSVSAVWTGRNGFRDSSDCVSMLDFLATLGEENYAYESVTEDEEPEIGGNYYFKFARVTRYEVDGTPVDLDDIACQNRKPRGFFRRGY